MTVSAQAVSVLCRTPVYSVAMQISYFHVPAEMPQDLRPDAAVVIDVLRATTTIAWALHNGAEAVQAFASLDDLRSAAAAWPADARLLLGERGGQMLEGFDLGNSPVAVNPERVAGKRLFMSTTNGTRALDRVRQVPLLLRRRCRTAMPWLSVCWRNNPAMWRLLAAVGRGPIPWRIHWPLAPWAIGCWSWIPPGAAPPTTNSLQPFPSGVSGNPIQRRVFARRPMASG